MKMTVSTKGRITLPAEMRNRDNVRPGQTFEIVRIGRGKYRLARQKLAPNEGLVDLLLRCPVKNLFVPIESESTDPL